MNLLQIFGFCAGLQEHPFLSFRPKDADRHKSQQPGRQRRNVWCAVCPASFSLPRLRSNAPVRPLFGIVSSSAAFHVMSYPYRTEPHPGATLPGTLDAHGSTDIKTAGQLSWTKPDLLFFSARSSAGFVLYMTFRRSSGESPSWDPPVMWIPPPSARGGLRVGTGLFPPVKPAGYGAALHHRCQTPGVLPHAGPETLKGTAPGALPEHQSGTRTLPQRKELLLEQRYRKHGTFLPCLYVRMRSGLFEPESYQSPDAPRFPAPVCTLDVRISTPSSPQSGGRWNSSGIFRQSSEPQTMPLSPESSDR